jgi:hypothetical protein
MVIMFFDLYQGAKFGVRLGIFGFNGRDPLLLSPLPIFSFQRYGG